jgi:hypothetical protein
LLSNWYKKKKKKKKTVLGRKSAPPISVLINCREGREEELELI